ncbi:MAG: hypothetical protein J1F24_04350 [Oscillospiraceae bacterium]|nr:hypothetical protein [Oscillospiraceae bacterium]
MENFEIKLRVPCGYQIREKAETLDINLAYEILRTKSQHRYTKAVRNGWDAELSRHVIRCPFCGREVPAYPHFLRFNVKTNTKVPAPTVADWATLQTSLFDSENRTLYIQQPENHNVPYSCRKCGYTSIQSNNTIDILIRQNKQSIYILKEIRDLKVIADERPMFSVNIKGESPIFEGICFNIVTGQTCLMLTDENEKALYVNDITDFFDQADCGIFTELLSKNRVVKRILKRLFEQHWNTVFPFASNELSLDKFCLMTRFTGFERNFYDAVPYEKNSYEIESTFECIANRLKNPTCAMELLENSALPNVKSIRRLFSQNAGLLFYIKECEKLFELFKDLNMLCQILSSENVYSLLSMLHIYPGMLTFYYDYCRVKGRKSLCRHLAEHCLFVNEQAIQYCALGTDGQISEQVKWKQKRKYFNKSSCYFPFDIPSFSIPMRAAPNNIPDCSIGCFRFQWLRTMKEYQLAGKQLDNCLSCWQSDQNPVVVVYRGDKIIAAIEIEGNEILQAFQYHNSYIDKESELAAAIQKWCDKHQLINLTYD